MSLELRLLPVGMMWSNGTSGNCHTILNAPQDYRVFDEVRERATLLPASHDFTAHLGGRIQSGTHAGSPCYGKLDRDSYGELYRWIRADVLGPILWKHYPAHPVSAYVAALAPDTMIVLDWH